MSDGPHTDTALASAAPCARLRCLTPASHAAPFARLPPSRLAPAAKALPAPLSPGVAGAQAAPLAPAGAARLCASSTLPCSLFLSISLCPPPPPPPPSARGAHAAIPKPSQRTASACALGPKAGNLSDLSCRPVVTFEMQDDTMQGLRWKTAKAGGRPGTRRPGGVKRGSLARVPLTCLWPVCPSLVPASAGPWPVVSSVSRAMNILFAFCVAYQELANQSAQHAP